MWITWNQIIHMLIMVLFARGRGFMLIRLGRKQNSILDFCASGKTTSCLHMTYARNQPDFVANCSGLRAGSLLWTLNSILIGPAKKDSTQPFSQCMWYTFQRAFQFHVCFLF